MEDGFGTMFFWLDEETKFSVFELSEFVKSILLFRIIGVELSVEAI
jgi:hypothetical protein